MNYNLKNAPVITIDHLNFSYGKKQILNDINLSVNEGEIFTLIGPNGCGKSTLLKLTNRLLDQDTSQHAISIYNKDLKSYERKELACTVAVLPQSRNLPNITVQRLVEHGRFPHLDLTRRLRAIDHQKIQEALATMELESYRNKYLSQLSGGECQRAYIAMALAQDTPLLFLDEPTTYLDIRHQLELLQNIEQLNQKHHKTILMVLHDLNLALKFSHRIAVMLDGRIIFTGTPVELIQTDILKTAFNVTCVPVEIDGATEYIIRS